MTDGNVEIVNGMYNAFAAGDVPAVLAVLDPEVEWCEAENFIYADGNPYRGPNAILEGVFLRLATEWDGFAVSPETFLDAGDAVVGLGYYSGVYKATGAAIRAQFAHVFTFRDSRVVRFQQYTDTWQFRQAVADWPR